MAEHPLTLWLCERLDPDTAARIEPAAMEPRLAEHLSRARAAWPDFGVDDRTHVTKVAECLGLADDPVAALERLRAADLRLAIACGLGLAPAIAAFEQSVLAHVDVAMRDLGADQRAEVRQRVRASLFATDDPKIRGYAGRGDLRNWTRAVVVREAIKLRTRDGRERTDDEALERVAAGDDDPELSHMKGLYRDAFKLSFRAALDSLTARERNLLRHQVIDRLGIDAIASLYHVHRATAARWLARAREGLLARTRRDLAQRLRLSHGELESVMGLIESRLDVSLSRLLAK